MVSGGADTDSGICSEQAKTVTVTAVFTLLQNNSQLYSGQWLLFSQQSFRQIDEESRGEVLHESGSSATIIIQPRFNL